MNFQEFSHGKVREEIGMLGDEGDRVFLWVEDEIFGHGFSVYQYCTARWSIIVCKQFNIIDQGGLAASCGTDNTDDVSHLQFKSFHFFSLACFSEAPDNANALYVHV